MVAPWRSQRSMRKRHVEITVGDAWSLLEWGTGLEVSFDEKVTYGMEIPKTSRMRPPAKGCVDVLQM